MDQSFSHQENSIEKQHPKPNPENYTQSKAYNTSDFDPSVSKSNSNFHKPFSAAQEQSDKASSNMNYSGNNPEIQAIKQGSKVKNELDAVPEISVEYSQITNKTTQPDEIFKGRPEYDNEDRNLTKSKRNMGKGYYHYQPHSTNTSKSLDFKIEKDIQNGIGKHYISPTHKISTEEDPISKYRENRERRHARESISTSKHNFTATYDRKSPVERDNPIYKSSHLDRNIRTSESMSKLSKSDFQSRDFKGSMSFQGQEFKEIRKLKDENEKLTERLRIKEKELQESKKHNDEFYRKYREIQNELNAYQKEKEVLLAEKVKLAQQEHRDSASSRKETDELRQINTHKDKVIRDLQAQVAGLKADITFMNQKNEAKMDALKLEGQRLEEENSRLMQSMRKSETKRDNLIHQLEMSYDQEKLSLRKHLQESVSQLQLVTNKNDDLTHKIERMNKDNLKRERAYLEKLDESAYENKKAIEDHIIQAKEEISQQFQSKLHSLQGKVSRLSAENENLRLELQSKPSLRKFKEYEIKIHALETELENTKGVHHIEHEHRKKPSEIGLPTKILKEVAEELDVDSIGEILPKLRDIKQEQKTDSKLVHSLLELVSRCSPPGRFDRRPTHKQAWTWIKDIMEEYMMLKKHEEEGSKFDTKRDILGTVMDFLNAKDVHEVPGKLKQVLGDNIGMNKVLTKVKVLHKLEWVNSLHELEQRIQSEINTKYEDPYLRSSYYKRNNS